MVSSTVGAGISWTYSQPTGISTVNFSNNTALQYGDNVAGVPTYLKPVSAEYYNAYSTTRRRDLSVSVGDPYPNSTIQDTQPGGLLPTIYMGIFDGYDNLVRNLNEGELQASVTGVTGSETYAPFLTFTTTISVKDGFFKIGNLNYSRLFIIKCISHAFRRHISLFKLVFTILYSINLTIH